MKETELKLECLKLAAQVNKSSKDLVLQIAQAFYDFAYVEEPKKEEAES